MPVVLLALGFVLLTLGVSALLLAAAFWRREARQVLAFGVFALLYSVGLLARSGILHPLLGLSDRTASAALWFVNYWSAIPAIIYTEEVRGPGWRNSTRRLWQGWIVLASALTLIDIISGNPGRFGREYLPFVIAMLAILLFNIIRKRPDGRGGRRVQQAGGAIFLLSMIFDNIAGVVWPSVGVTLEPFGAVAFVGSLGFITGREFFARERELAVVEHEMKTARGIQESLLPAARVSLPRLEIAARYLPMRGIAGDLYDFHIVDDHRVGVLVADVTGHGVPAALIASMVKVAFTAERASAAEPAVLLTAMNRSLCGNLTSQFVTAAYVFVDAHANEIRYSVAGHPPPILWSSSSRDPVELCDSNGIFMGFSPETTYQERRRSLDAGDRVLLYTDGLTEAQNAAGTMFGDHRLREAFMPGDALPAEAFAGMLVQELRSFSGIIGDSRSFDDDLTLVVVDIGRRA